MTNETNGVIDYSDLLIDDTELEEVAETKTNMLSPELEQQRQHLLQKIQLAQSSLRLTDKELEKTKNSNLTPQQQRELEVKLDTLQAVLFGGQMAVKVRESQGETINPEERNVEVMKAAVDFKRGFDQEHLWEDNQYVTDDHVKKVNSINSDIETSNDLSSHIRK